MCGTCPVYIIGVEQQVLEVQHCVFLLVFGKEFGVVHFGYECPNAFRHLSVDVRRVGFVGILHCIVVYFQHRLLVVGLALRVANVLDGFAVAVGKALWVKEILPFVAMLHLEHKVRKKNYLLVFLLPFVVVHYGVFALLPVFGNDADGFFVVDDGRVGGYFPLFKQEFGTEMVHVSYLQTARVVVFHHRANTVQHFACSTVGKRKAQHISVFQPLLPCVAYALGKNMSLSAPWRCQNKVVSVLCVYYLSLTFVEQVVCFHFFHSLFVGYADKSTKKKRDSRTMVGKSVWGGRAHTQRMQASPCRSVMQHVSNAKLGCLIGGKV